MNKQLVMVFGEIHRFDFVGVKSKIFLDAHLGQTITLDEQTGEVRNWTEKAAQMGDLDAIGKASGKNMIAALQEVMWINDPDHFILGRLSKEKQGEYQDHQYGNSRAHNQGN